MALDISIARDADDAFVNRVAELVNQVYADAEKGIWQPGALRTSVAEMESVVRAGELAVARLDGELVGAVRLQRLDSGEGEFGMLVADPAHRGLGIGRALVAFAEDWARDRGLPTMQLELLVPRGWTHPVKEFLRDWYTRLGYRAVRSDPFEEAHPALQPLLATGCDFVVYHKPLR
ncbi:GNAT family N-acetyltransferase [Asanoa sp. WMMD1127]|uniref:GNAT family N-acetyltransferase n=1 Tax=Asanoa sp. WMMD1127 TaxID=3016107 RepID=UPI0024163F1C|nr:GNAT family N-acetyltransferase [Asanoa sp. WMMD1127]MDG4822723.1 GNAT family N-acetyltransferase [Asanoa sp. WMMD1127]